MTYSSAQRSEQEARLHRPGKNGRAAVYTDVLEPTSSLPPALTPDSCFASPLSGRSVSLLSRAERSRCIERGVAGLYRWYVGRSQTMRRWNPDSDFDWGRLRRDHDDGVHTVIEGFYGVEQYAPD